MRQTNGTGRRSSEKIVKDIKRATRKQNRIRPVCAPLTFILASSSRA
ncbi:MAG: hypothetical protein JKY99_04600 [Rhizobiales bacterium]|nr:hypothetical protein [Hyphomicrobiales bacterium]